MAVSLSNSKCFHGIGSLVFSKFWHVPRNPCEVVRVRVEFFENDFFCILNGGNVLKIYCF